MVAQSATAWGEAEVVAVKTIADDIRELVLRTERVQAAPPGAHVDIEVKDGDRRLIRSYSVVRSHQDRLTLAVRLSPQSRGGSRAVHALHVGERIRLSTPLQNFPLGVGAARYVLLAGGIGVTALLAMGEVLRRRGADYTFVQVARSTDTAAFTREVATHGERARLCLDDQGTGLDAADLVAEIADHQLADSTELYMCGPIRLMDAVRRAWASHGLPAANLRFETFGNSGTWQAEEFVVSIPEDNVSVTVSSALSPLDALEQAGIDVMSDCRKGECGLCVVRVRSHSGRIDHRDVFLSDEQKATGSRICLCVSRAAGGRGAPGELVIDRP